MAGLISDLRMEPAKNGVIISYTEKTKAPGKSTYDNYNYKYEKEVFDFDDTEGEKFEEAFKRFKELWKIAFENQKS